MVAAAQTASAQKADEEKCFGIAKKGANDCTTVEVTLPDGRKRKGSLAEIKD